MAVVLLVTLFCGYAAQRSGQARVIGEIVGGILLGPSVLGRMAPFTFNRLFPAGVLSSFEVLSTFGLVLYLFLIGTSMDLAHLRTKRRTAAITSACSILLPLGLSILLLRPLRNQFSSPLVSATAFGLFLGVSLSITAFPVLARILEERGLTATPLGTTALLSAAADDVCAWLLLSVALSLLPHPGHDLSVRVRLLWLLCYVGSMCLIVRPLARWMSARTNGKALPPEVFGCAIALLLLSAFTTDVIGIHPLFGAFLAGLCFPRVPVWQQGMRDKLEPLSTVLLPFFFALTGMKTRLDLLHGFGVWFWTGAILALAVIGKMGGALIAARSAGEGWRDALALGALLNTRGLVELIVLNIALSVGVFTPALFAMLVVMALVTTAMTMPVLNVLDSQRFRLSAKR